MFKLKISIEKCLEVRLTLYFLEPNSKVLTEEFEVKRYLNSEEDQHPLSAYRNGVQMEQVDKT